MSASIKIDDAWMAEFGKYGMPLCRYCRTPCRKGGYADHFYPYHTERSFHVSCHRKQGARP